MGEIVKAAPALLDSLASEARYYSEAAANNLFQLARVLTEAKKLVPHGQWGAWIEQNAGCSERTAQQMMQAYARYAERPEVARLDRSKVFKLLALPPEIEEEFFEAHEALPNMSARELNDAIREAVEEAELKAKLKMSDMRRAMNIAQQDADQQRRRAEKAEADYKRVLADPPVPEDMAERIAAVNRENIEIREELDRMSQAAQEALTETNALRREKTELQGRIAEMDAGNRHAQSAQIESEREVRIRLIKVEMERAELREKKLRAEFNDQLERLQAERMKLKRELEALKHE